VFAHVAIDEGYPEVGAAAVICFEWLQRPENVLAGFIRWTDYRGSAAPTAIRITHHKAGAVVERALAATGSDTHIDSRVVQTSREQNFRMGLRNRFRMNSKNKP